MNVDFKALFSFTETYIFKNLFEGSEGLVKFCDYFLEHDQTRIRHKKFKRHKRGFKRHTFRLPKLELLRT